jgi:hypothetical protein
MLLKVAQNTKNQIIDIMRHLELMPTSMRFRLHSEDFEAQF